MLLVLKYFYGDKCVINFLDDFFWNYIFYLIKWLLFYCWCFGNEGGIIFYDM